MLNPFQLNVEEWNETLFTFQTLILFSFDSIIHLSVPLITVSPENKKINTGTNVVLLCDAEGNPRPNFFWSKDEHTLKFTNRIYLATDNKTLNIEHIKESDAGLYACIAENILGSDEATAQVEVINTYGPPIILFEPYDLEAIPGTTIELPCGVGESDLPSPLVIRQLSLKAYLKATKCN